MNERIWGIIGGVALLLALLSPLVLGNSKKVEGLFEDAETLYERSDYAKAIEKYKEALKESNKLGAKTEQIDKDFTTLVNLKIAQCYYHLAEKTHDINYYKEALGYIEKVSSKVHVAGHQEELTHLWADILYKTEKFDSAESKFNQLIKDFPKSSWTPKALYIIGEINYQQENRQKTLSTLKRLVDEFPHSEFTAEATQRINELSFSDDPKPPDSELVPPDVVMYNDATNLKQQGKVHDANQLYTDLIAQFPNSEHITDAYVGKAEIHLQAENHVKARENYEEAIHSTKHEERKVELYEAYHRTYLVPVYASIQPEPSDGLFVKGRLLRKEHRFQEAAEIYERLTNSNLSIDDTVYVLYWAGRCYHDAAQNSTAQNSTLTDAELLRKSVDAFNKLIADHEDSSYTIKAYYYLVLAYSNWTEILADQGKYQLIIDTVDKAETKYANNSDSSVHGWLRRMQDIKDEARKKLPLPDGPPEPGGEHTVINGENPSPHTKQENRNTQSTEKVDERPKRATQEIPDKNKHYGLGLTFFDESQYTKAIEALKNAINIDPKFKEAHFYLGVVYLKQKRHIKATKAFEAAIRIDPEFKEAYYNLSLAHLELNDREKAREAASGALKIDPNYAPAQLLIEFVDD